MPLEFFFHQDDENFDMWQGCQRAAKHSFCFVAALTNLQCLEGKKLGISKSDSLYLPT